MSKARFSTCRAYRYELTRTWDKEGPRLVYVMLNPSKADAFRNDPTVERCERRARMMGFGAFRVVNIFAWRETSPAELRKAAQPVGPLNDDILIEAADWANQIIAAWGVHGTHLNRSADVSELLEQCGHPLFHLGLSKEGHPRHPLYVGYAVGPTLWEA